MQSTRAFSRLHSGHLLAPMLILLYHQPTLSLPFNLHGRYLDLRASQKVNCSCTAFALYRDDGTGCKFYYGLCVNPAIGTPPCLFMGISLKQLINFQGILVGSITYFIMSVCMVFCILS